MTQIKSSKYLTEAFLISTSIIFSSWLWGSKNLDLMEIKDALILLNNQNSKNLVQADNFLKKENGPSKELASLSDDRVLFFDGKNRFMVLNFPVGQSAEIENIWDLSFENDLASHRSMDVSEAVHGYYFKDVNLEKKKRMIAAFDGFKRTVKQIEQGNSSKSISQLDFFAKKLCRLGLAKELIVFLKHPSFSVQKSVAFVLSEKGYKQSLPVLLRASRTLDEKSREKVYLIINRLTGKSWSFPKNPNQQDLQFKFEKSVLEWFQDEQAKNVERKINLK